MLKHVCKILLNEWRSNLLIAIEMLLITLCSIYLVDHLVAQFYQINRPMGCSIDNVGRIRISKYPPESPDYIAGRDNDTLENEAIQTILSRLEHHPAVEAISISRNSLPHQGNNNSNSLQLDTITVERALDRLVTPSFFRVFRIEGITGTREELIESLEKREIVACASLAQAFRRTPETFFGAEIHLEQSGDSRSTTRVGGVCKPMRIDNFWYTWYSFFHYNPGLYKVLHQYYNWFEFAIRLKDDAALTFQDLLAELKPQLRADNFYVSEIQDLRDIRTRFQQSDYNALKLRMLYISFLGVCIFLGIVGTFWYRTQERRSQIGLRLAVGGTPASTMKLFLLEGILILFSTLLFTLPAYYLGTVYRLLSMPWLVFPTRMLLVFVITYCIFGFLIILAIWLPCRNAVKISPAIAMHDE